VTDVIRFSCQHCHREYLLPDAMAHLPLLCKQCGQRLSVPDPQPEPKPEPPPPAPRPAPPVSPPAPPAAVAPAAPRGDARPPAPVAEDVGPPTPPPADDHGRPAEVPSLNGDEFLSRDTLDRLDVPAEVTPPPGQAWGAPVLHKPTPAAPPAKTRGAGAPHPPKAAPAAPPVAASRRVLAVVVDVVVAIVLLGLGVLVGEFATRKSTAEILDGVSGPRFPSVDLLVWLGGPALLLLIYVWLGTRGWTVGGWLKRRG
jgi:hypothetical protein